MSKPKSLTAFQAKVAAATAVANESGRGPEPKPRRIVILPSGWVFCGLWEEANGRVVLTRAVGIRRWGTTAGLGQLALEGPTKSTVLDKAGTVSFVPGSEIAALDCISGKGWE